MLKRSKDVEGDNKDAITPASPGAGDAGTASESERKTLVGAELTSAELAAQLQAKDQELGELKDKYLRALADTDNVRKRMRQQNEEAVRLQREGLLRDLLHITHPHGGQRKRNPDRRRRIGGFDFAAARVHPGHADGSEDDWK